MRKRKKPAEIREQVNFTWFDRKARKNFERYAPETIDRYLEIGVWEGASFFWILHHRQPKNAVAIDPYPADRRRSEAENKARGDQFQRRWDTNYPRSRGVLYRESSKTVLPKLWLDVAEGRTPPFCMIYIDGSHHGRDVLFDGVLAAEMLRPGGVLIFDDFGNRRKNEGLQLAVDTIQRLHHSTLTAIRSGAQVILTRRPEAITVKRGHLPLGDSLLI